MRRLEPQWTTGDGVRSWWKHTRVSNHTHSTWTSSDTGPIAERCCPVPSAAHSSHRMGDFCLCAHISAAGRTSSKSSREERRSFSRLLHICPRALAIASRTARLQLQIRHTCAIVFRRHCISLFIITLFNLLRYPHAWSPAPHATQAQGRAISRNARGGPDEKRIDPCGCCANELRAAQADSRACRLIAQRWSQILAADCRDRVVDR